MINWKSFGAGAILAICFILVVGGAYAAIANSGQTITVPIGKTAIYFVMSNSDAAYLRDALCHNYHYQENITSENGGVVPNPQSCADFGQTKIVQFAKEHMAAYHQWQYENNYVGQSWNVSG